MQQLIVNQVRAWVRGQPRAAKLAFIQSYILPECDLEDLAGMTAIINAEVHTRKAAFTKMLQGMLKS